jgi:predicted Co/Zn/Cd cation transporter (cation efflux family)
VEANKREKLKFGLTAKELLIIFLIGEVVFSTYRIIRALRSGGDALDEIGRLVFGLVTIGIALLIYFAVKRSRRK